MTTQKTAPVRSELTAEHKGQQIAAQTITLSRDSLVRYAGASGDFNPIHYNDEFARSVGLDSVIAHGMLTMGSVIAPVVDWAGDPGAISAYESRFTKPVPVPALGSADLEVTAVVGAVDEAKREARIDLTVRLDGATVLGKCRATVRLDQTSPFEGDGANEGIE